VVAPSKSELAVALTGFDATMRGDESAVHGLSNKVISATSELIPPGFAAQVHRPAAPLHR
jgi:hypothetical protein